MNTFAAIVAALLILAAAFLFGGWLFMLLVGVATAVWGWPGTIDLGSAIGFFILAITVSGYFNIRPDSSS